MKYSFKNSLPLSVMALALIMASCGKKENKVNSNTVTGTSPIIISQAANALKNTIACLPGRTRLAQDANFYVSGTFTGTTVGANTQWTPGIMPGALGETFVGVSAYRDLMFLTKVTNGGSQVIGYNVSLSFCDVANPNPNFPLLVSNDRSLVQFRTPYGITINTATPCGYGLIAAALETFILSQRNSNPYTADFPVATSFTKPNCQ